MSPFDPLSPELVLQSIEATFDLPLDSQVITYPSYINRVYGLKTEEGEPLVAKFYRPGRWTTEGLEEEQEFLEDCGLADLPVILPMPDPEGYTLGEVEVETSQGGVQVYNFSLFQKRAGRVFDGGRDEDWLRLGRLMGRVHEVGRKKIFKSRVTNSPELTKTQVENLLPGVHVDCLRDFKEVCSHSLELIQPLFEGATYQRIHGDSHRGNILSREPEGLLLMDFDDCQMGVPVQDLWLLLPGARQDSQREIALLSEGYGEFSDPWNLNWDLVEPLRFMRMIHFLSWCQNQKEDKSFSHNFPGWGSRGFWIKEVEDLREQLARISQD